MGIRENKVEKYLDAKIVELGGITRKWVSPGRDGVPDRIIFLPYGCHALRPCSINHDEIYFVEVKTFDGVLAEWQDSEHKTLRTAGADVTTVYGQRGVDGFIDYIVTRGDGYLEWEYR